MTAATNKNSNGILIYSLNVIYVPKLSSVGYLWVWLESRECDAVTTPDRQTPPGENSANSGPAGLVPVPEFSIFHTQIQASLTKLHLVITFEQFALLYNFKNTNRSELNFLLN